MTSVEPVAMRRSMSSLASRRLTGLSRCGARSRARKTPRTVMEATWASIFSGGAVSPLIRSRSRDGRSPWVTVHSNTGSPARRDADRTISRTRASSTLSSAITGWRDAMSVAISWMVVVALIWATIVRVRDPRTAGIRRPAGWPAIRSGHRADRPATRRA